MATRRLGPEGENGWAFGQVMALVALATPLLSALEYLSGPTPAAAPGSVSIHVANEAAGTITDAETATVTTLPQREASGETEYERSPAFRGILFLAVWFWVACTVFLYRSAPTEFHLLVLSLLVEVVLPQPVLQVTWSLFCIWLEKHNPRDWMASGLRYLVFLALLEASVLEFFTSEPTALSIVVPAIISGSLVVLYAMSLLWSLLELRARARDEALDQSTSLRIPHRRFAQLMATICPVLLGSTIGVALIQSPEHPNEAWVFFAIVVCFQATWMGLEWILSRSRVTETRRQAFRTVILIAMGIFLVVWGYFQYEPAGFRLFGPGPFFVTIMGFSVLSLGWTITTTVSWRS